MERRLNDLEAYAEELVVLYVQAHQNVEMLDSLGTTIFVECLQDSFGAHAFDALVNVLIGDVIRGAWALALDKAETTPSIVNIWSMANRSGVLPTLRERFCDRRTEDTASDRDGTRDNAACLQQFDEAVDRLRREVPAVTGSPAAARFTAARHKGIAHHEMQRRPMGSPKRFDVASTEIGWEGLRAYVESLAPLVRDLALIVTGVDHPLAAAHEHHRINVLDFWMRIRGEGRIEPR
jgi:hypothetical protein